jgi:hypothetical protein
MWSISIHYKSTSLYNSLTNYTYYRPLVHMLDFTSKIFLDINLMNATKFCYIVFHGFGQAKFPNGRLVLGSCQFSLLPQLPLKTMLNWKVVKFNFKKWSSSYANLNPWHILYVMKTGNKKALLKFVYYNFNVLNFFFLLNISSKYFQIIFHLIRLTLDPQTVSKYWSPARKLMSVMAELEPLTSTNFVADEGHG